VKANIPLRKSFYRGSGNIKFIEIKAGEDYDISDDIKSFPILIFPIAAVKMQRIRQSRDDILKLLRIPGIDSKESTLYGTTTLFQLDS
jgi:hypothetical protein